MNVLRKTDPYKIILSMLSKMHSKSVYALQPYEVGSNKGKSLAIIIPAKIAKECNVNPSTIFAIQVDKQRGTIILQTVRKSYENDVIPADESLETSKQQASMETQ
jgi:antitoxin component of MazEF toxin-antitoxin module